MRAWCPSDHQRPHPGEVEAVCQKKGNCIVHGLSYRACHKRVNGGETRESFSKDVVKGRGYSGGWKCFVPRARLSRRMKSGPQGSEFSTLNGNPRPFHLFLKRQGWRHDDVRSRFRPR